MESNSRGKTKMPINKLKCIFKIYSNNQKKKEKMKQMKTRKQRTSRPRFRNFYNYVNVIKFCILIKGLSFLD